MFCPLVDGLYYLNPKCYLLQDTDYGSVNLMHASKRRKISSVNEVQLWNLRLGHINWIQRMIKGELLGLLDIDSVPLCESCLEGKMTIRPFKTSDQRAFAPVELVHTDVCGFINVPVGGGYEYFITSTYYYSRYGYIYLMHYQSESFDKLKEFKAETEKQLDRSLKKFLYNRGGEYLSGELK